MGLPDVTHLMGPDLRGLALGFEKQMVELVDDHRLAQRDQALHTRRKPQVLSALDLAFPGRKGVTRIGHRRNGGFPSRQLRSESWTAS